MICPKCGFEQPSSPECRRCGVIVAKAREAAARRTAASAPQGQVEGPSRPDGEQGSPPPTRRHLGRSGPVPASRESGQTDSGSPRRTSPPRAQPVAQAGGEKPTRQGLPPWLAALTRPPPSLRRRVLFFREAGRLLEKGVPLDETLAATRRVVGRGPLAEALLSMQGEVREGVGLAAAMARHPLAFEPVEVALCETAERTGKLGELFGRMHERLEVLQEVKGKVAMSLLYPSLVVLMACLTMPLPLAFKDGVATYLLAAGGNLFLLALAAALFGVALPRLLQYPPWRAAMLAGAARVPGLGILMRRRRFALVFAALSAGLECGVDVHAAIELATRASGEPAVIAAGGRISARLKAGDSLSAAAAEMPDISEETLALLATGERTGDLAEAATRQAQESSRKFRDAVQVAGLVFRFAASLLITALVAISIVSHFQKVLGDPMSMLPDAQREEIQRELDRAMPRMPGK